MGPILAIAVKDLRLLLRDRTAAFFTFGFPLVIAIFFGFIFGGMGGGGGDDAMEIAVWAQGPGAEEFAKALDADDAIKVISVPTREAGQDMVRKGKVVACLELDKDFDAKGIFAGGLQIKGVVDPKRKAEAGLLTGKLNQIAFMQISTVFRDPKATREMMDHNRKMVQEGGASPMVKAALGVLFNSVDTLSENIAAEDKKANGTSGGGGTSGTTSGGGWTPVKVDLKELAVRQDGPPNSFTVSFPQGVVWGLMGCVMAFATSFVKERVAGTLSRLSVAPISAGVVLAGKSLACFITCALVQTLMIVVASVPPFRVHVAEPVMMACTIFASSLGFTGVMALIAGLSRTEGAAEGSARAVMIVLALIGGGSIPLMFLPPLVRMLSGVSPFKWVAQAWEGALWRGLGLDAMALPLGVLAGVGVIGYLAGAAVLKRQTRA